MKLFKKHIGQIFDCEGGDGSWYYQLVDVKKGELLFAVNGEKKFEISTNTWSDWRPFQEKLVLSKKEIKEGWLHGRRDK